MKKLFALFVMFVAATVFSCSGNSPAPDENTNSSAAMALTTTQGGVNYCFAGTIEIRFAATLDTDPADYSYPTDCTDSSHNIVLAPGDYKVTIAGLDCSGTVPLPTGYTSCALTPDPTPFTVNLGETTQVPITVTLYADDEYVVTTGVGSGNLYLDTPVEEAVCGTEVCVAGEFCADYEGTGLACYEQCTTADDTVLNAGTCTGVGEMCVPMAGSGTSTFPQPVPIGTDLGTGSLNDLLHGCVVIP